MRQILNLPELKLSDTVRYSSRKAVSKIMGMNIFIYSNYRRQPNQTFRNKKIKFITLLIQSNSSSLPQHSATVAPNTLFPAKNAFSR